MHACPALLRARLPHACEDFNQAHCLVKELECDLLTGKGARAIEPRRRLPELKIEIPAGSR